MPTSSEALVIHAETIHMKTESSGSFSESFDAEIRPGGDTTVDEADAPKICDLGGLLC